MLLPLNPSEPTHLEAIATIWNEAGGNCFTISPDFVDYNLQPVPGLIQEGRLLLEGREAAVGFVISSLLTSDASTSPPNHGWIDAIAVLPAYQGRGHGSNLLGWAEDWLRSIGCEQVTLGASIRPFVPGLPRELFSEQFFLSRGFANRHADSSPIWDVFADLGKYAPPKSVSGIDGVVRPATPGDEEHLLSFLRQEFPGRWRFETEDYLRIGGRISDYMLLWTDSGVKSFCWLTFEDSKRPLERYYPYVLPRPWGQLGPIGVSAGSRGKGYGAAVLDAGLRRLRDTGVRGCVIDWTDKVDFYSKFGFDSYRSYWPMYKELA